MRETGRSRLESSFDGSCVWPEAGISLAREVCGCEEGVLVRHVIVADAPDLGSGASDC